MKVEQSPGRGRDLLWVVEERVEDVTPNETWHQHPPDEGHKRFFRQANVATATFGKLDAKQDTQGNENAEWVNRHRTNVKLVKIYVRDH